MTVMRRIVSLVFIAALLVGSVSVASDALAEEATFGGGSAQGYASDSPIDDGMIVRLTGDKSDRVTLATQAELPNMFGVTVNPSQLPLTVSQGLENEVFVAVSGTYTVRVSTQAGPIADGDYVTLSSINGVAMKATDEETVFGRAHLGFDGKGVVLGTSTLVDVNGDTSKEVKIGSVPVTIDIRSNPNKPSTQVNVPEFLQRLGEQIAEKEVSPIRIYLSLGITFVSILAAIAILYSGIRNSIVAIGRNPMSKKSIFLALIEIILTSILILIIGLFAVYLLLRL